MVLVVALAAVSAAVFASTLASFSSSSSSSAFSSSLGLSRIPQEKPGFFKPGFYFFQQHTVRYLPPFGRPQELEDGKLLGGASAGVRPSAGRSRGVLTEFERSSG